MSTQTHAKDTPHAAVTQREPCRRPLKRDEAMLTINEVAAAYRFNSRDVRRDSEVGILPVDKRVWRGGVVAAFVHPDDAYAYYLERTQ